MANISEQLLTPEQGMQRIDNSNVNIKYIGVWKSETSTTAGYYNNTATYSYDLSSTCEFYIYSSSIYIVGQVFSNRSNKIEISIDGNIEYYSGYDDSVYGIPNYVQYVKTGLDKTIHKVIIKNTIEDKAILIDAIDIDEDGYMVYCDDNGDLYYDVTPIMTSNTTPSPYVVSYSSVFVDRYNAFQAFDGATYGDNTSFAPNANNGWLCLDFGNKIKSNAFIIGTGSESFFNKEAYPKSIELSISDNNIEFSPIENYTNIKEWTMLENRKFMFNTQNSRFYKINVPLIGNAQYLNIAEIRYLLAVDTPFYLIQDNADNKVYNYDEENNTLVEVTDTSILKEDALKNTCIYDLTKIVPLLDTLSDDLTIISNNNKKIIANGIKSNKELIIGKNSFSTKIARNIDYFQLDENATAKIIFSIDDGTTWKTYNTSTNTFEDLSISIPVDKDYSDFTEEEKIAWEEAKEIAYNQGIDSSILTTINFNEFNSEKMKFGYVLTATDTETMDKMTNLIWHFDSKGVMELVNPSDVKQQLFYGGVKLVSNIDADMLKVNITYEGISGEGSGGTATSLDIDRTVEEIQSDIDSIF